MKQIYALTVIALLFCSFCSCNLTKKDAVPDTEDDEEVAEDSITKSSASLESYLYLDDTNVIHIDEYCLMLRCVSGEKENVQGKTYIDTLIFINDASCKYCTYCVTQDYYEHIQQILRRNKANYRQRTYDMLFPKYYDVSYDEFDEMLGHSSSRQQIYRTLVNNDLIEESYSTFAAFVMY